MRTGVSPDRLLRFVCGAVFLLLTAACASTPQPASAPSLAQSIDAAIARPPFDRAIWGIAVVEDDGRVLYERNGRTLMIPASNRKLYASATIATCLGLGTRLETAIYRDGDDLVVRGDGDPSLGSWRYERSDDFDRLAASLRAKGTTRVRDVIADVSLFDRTIIPGGWKHGNLGQDYAAPVDALAWGENEIAGDLSISDPALYTAAALRDALVAAGIEVSGVLRANTEPHEWQEKIASLPSPFVAGLLATVLKNSHNLYAEMLFKRVSGGSYDQSFEIEKEFLEREAGVPAGGFRFVDGSGLAPDDLVAPESTIAILRWMNEPERRGYWWSILATPGEEGTLRRRLVTLSERMRGKTGTINGVNALSGVLEMPDGHFRYFSIAVNHHIGDGDEALAIIDSIVDRIAQ
jgi:D-alanyl-D-alanine carboxypeptidase/D-alanyl-D-alanine-endopeptidase (penicillin-binding protein 4)